MRGFRRCGADAGSSIRSRACDTHELTPIAYDRRVAYDEELAGRIRAQVGADPTVTEKRMFGGLAFLVAGNMAIAASGQGGALVHVDPAQSEALVASTSA